MQLSVNDSLRSRSRAELEECHTFWIGGEPPRDRGEMIRSVERAMQDAGTVRTRLKALPPTVIQVLAAALGEPGYALGARSFRESPSSQPDFELDSALAALVRRGFLDMARDGGGNPSAEFAYTVPCELGDLASRSVKETLPSTEAVFTLAEFAERLSLTDLRERAGLEGRVSRDAILDCLADPGSVAKRIAAIGDEGFRNLVQRLIGEFGGILTRSQFEKIQPCGIAWEPARFRAVLEASLLGTCTTVSLEELGVNLMEQVITAFVEIVRGQHLEDEFDPGRIDRVAVTGVDALSDLSRLLAVLRDGDARVTRMNRPYRAFSRRFSRRMVFRPERFFSSTDLIEYFAHVLVDLRLVRITADHRLQPTEAARRFEELSLFDKLRKIFGAVLTRPDEGESRFHIRGLRRNFLNTLPGLSVDQWYDPMAVPFVARNRYLVDLGQTAVQARYGSPHPYAGPPSGAEPARMAYNLYEFMRKRLYPLGIVDLAFRGERIVAIRLTELGAVVLGSTPPDDGQGEERPLVVNPDFEILLFPEGRSYALVHKLDQFATRTKTERIQHYRITPESVSRALVGGLDTDEILATLEASARTPIPQNVAYSIRDWASRVRFVTTRGARVIVAEDPETIDRILALGALRTHIRERVSETSLAMRARPDLPAIVQELSSIGIYFR